MMTQQPTLRTPSEGRTIAVVGDVYRFLATGDETNGKDAMWEAIVPPGGRMAQQKPYHRIEKRSKNCSQLPPNMELKSEFHIMINEHR
jgi:hypothetical protein